MVPPHRVAAADAALGGQKIGSATMGLTGLPYATTTIFIARLEAMQRGSIIDAPVVSEYDRAAASGVPERSP